jgi:hypothetical protein
VHLVVAAEESRNTDSALDHVAFAFDALDPVLTRLDRLKLPYSHPKLVPGTAIRQCFVTDPNGITVELQGP